jgi:hypothetical protein
MFCLVTSWPADEIEHQVTECIQTDKNDAISKKVFTERLAILTFKQKTLI